jgi:hypothetical protein
MTATESAPGQQAGIPTCYRHPRRETYTRCTRCDRWFTSWEGHLGGLLAGGALALAYAYAPARHRTLVQAGAAAGIVALAIVLVALKTSQINATVL